MCNCLNCGTEFNQKRRDQQFCSPKCAKEFNNREMVRGQVLYQAVMAWRGERGLDATDDFDAMSESDARKIVQDLVSAWKQEDREERPNGKSANDIRRWVFRNPWIKTVQSTFRRACGI
jgi:hypothetical protein